MRILILDDDPNRHKAFKRLFIGHLDTHVETASDCIEALRYKDWDILFIDRDLSDWGRPYHEAGTGNDVAEWLWENPDRIPPHVIVHSINVSGSRAIYTVIRANAPKGTVVERFPFAWQNLKVKRPSKDIVLKKPEDHEGLWGRFDEFTTDYMVIKEKSSGRAVRS